jgi:hypothetical protein
LVAASDSKAAMAVLLKPEQPVQKTELVHG